MLVFGVDIPLVEIILVFTIIIFILLVETVVIIALLVKQMNNTKKLSSLVVQLSETLIRLKEDFKR